MNIDEICLRVSEKSEGVHSPKNWARELNKGFKTPIRRAGNQNLLHNLEHGDKADYAWLSVLVAAYPGLPLLVGQFNPEGAAFNLLWYYGCARAGALIRRVFNPDQNQRFSMIPGLQVDRAIVLGIESRVKTLIKDLHSDKK